MLLSHFMNMVEPVIWGKYDSYIGSFKILGELSFFASLQSLAMVRKGGQATPSLLSFAVEDWERVLRNMPKLDRLALEQISAPKVLQALTGTGGASEDSELLCPPYESTRSYVAVTRRLSLRIRTGLVRTCSGGAWGGTPSARFGLLYLIMRICRRAIGIILLSRISLRGPVWRTRLGINYPYFFYPPFRLSSSSMVQNGMPSLPDKSLSLRL